MSGYSALMRNDYGDRGNWTDVVQKDKLEADLLKTDLATFKSAELERFSIHVESPRAGRLFLKGRIRSSGY
jgi:hypothetical protein